MPVARADYTLQTLAKGLAVLEALAATDDRGLTLTELAHRLRESTTVVFRLVRTLEDYGYVQQDPPSKRYTLGLRLWEMGARVVRRIGLVEAARPTLRWLTDITGQSTGLVVLQGADVLYLDIVEGSEPLRFYADPGSRAPAYATASGKAILAHRPDAVGRVVEGKLRKLTGATVTRASELRRRLPEIRQTGISINRGERRDDIAALAAPIFNASAECVAAVSISGPRSRLTEECMEDFAKHVRKAAEEISQKLGYRGEP